MLRSESSRITWSSLEVSLNKPNFHVRAIPTVQGTRSVRLAPVPSVPETIYAGIRRRALDQYKAGTARRVSSGKRINYSGPLVRRCAIRLAKSAGDAMTKDSGIMRALMTMSPQIATE